MDGDGRGDIVVLYNAGAAGSRLYRFLSTGSSLRSAGSTTDADTAVGGGGALLIPARERGPMPVLPFESDAQRTCTSSCKPMLEEVFGPVRERIHAIGYVYEIDGMTVTTTLVAWADDVVVANRAYLAGSVPMAEGVLRELARWTEAGRFGTFGVDDADNVYFEHQLLGSTVTTDSLGRSMRAAHAIADRTARRLPRAVRRGRPVTGPDARHASRPSGWMCRSGGARIPSSSCSRAAGCRRGTCCRTRSVAPPSRITST